MYQFGRLALFIKRGESLIREREVWTTFSNSAKNTIVFVDTMVYNDVVFVKAKHSKPSGGFSC
jgi:hypothetical protein